MKKNNKFFLFLFAVSALFAACQKKSENAENKGYTVRGTVDPALGLDSIFIYPKSVDGKTDEPSIAAAAVVDGKFVLTGKIDTIQNVNVGNYPKEIAVNLALENAEYQVNIHSSYAQTFGGKINEMVYGYYNTEEYKALWEKYKKKEEILMSIDMNDKSQQESIKQQSTELDALFDKLYKIETGHYHKLLNADTTPTIAKMLALTSLQDESQFDTEKKLEMLNEYEKELGPHRNLIEFRGFLTSSTDIEEMKKSVSNGNPLKPVVGSDPNGKKVDIYDSVQKNKYTLLEFWASWCGPCRGEVPNLKKAYEKYKDKGFEIYAFSIDEKEEDWKQALKEDNTDWVNVLSDGKEGNSISTSYGIDGIPASFLINQNGIIVASNQELRGEKLTEMLDKLLSE